MTKYIMLNVPYTFFVFTFYFKVYSSVVKISGQMNFGFHLQYFWFFFTTQICCPLKLILNLTCQIDSQLESLTGQFYILVRHSLLLGCVMLLKNTSYNVFIFRVKYVIIHIQKVIYD